MIDRILVPLDGSVEAEAALPHALGLARAFGSDVTLLRVVEANHQPGTRWTDPLEWRLARTQAMRYLEEVQPRFGDAARSVDLDVGGGSAAEEILEAARTRRADLLVITSHGEGGASEFPLAGTAHKVTSAAEVSLLIVPTERSEPSGPSGPILVPLDGSQRGEWALRLAATLARSLGATLLAVHVVRTPEILALNGAEHVRSLADEYVRASTAEAERYLEDTVARLAPADVPARTRVCAGTSVARAIEEVAVDEGAALVILSAHGRTASAGCPYGTVAGNVLSRARFPVLVLQDQPPSEMVHRDRWRSAGRIARSSRPPEASRSRNRT